MIATVFVNLPVAMAVREPGYVELVARAGVHAELGLGAEALDGVSAAQHAELGRRLRGAGVRCGVHLPFMDLRPGGADPVMREAACGRLARGMDLAMEYGAEHMVGHAAFHDDMDGVRREDWLDASVASWGGLLASREGYPRLCLENTHERSPEPIVALLERLPGVGACLDVGHWFCFGRGVRRADLGRWLDAFAPYLAHLHLHDNDGGGDAHLALGAGDIPLDELFAGLAARSLAPTATLEPHTVEDFRGSARYMREHPEWFGGAS